MNRTVRWSVFALLLLWPLGTAFAQALFSPPQDPLAGSRVFGAKGCAQCHAVDGVGGQVGPDLGRIPRSRSFSDLAAAMWNHLPRAADRLEEFGISRSRLNPRETGDLIGFLFTLNYFDPPGNVQAGHRLFSEKKCVVCHQVGGTGGVVGPDLDFLAKYGSPILFAAAMWNHGPGMAAAMRVQRIERATFTGSELLDLVAYLKSAAPAPAEGPLYVLPGRAEEGRRLFVDKRCIECHGAGGRGGSVGRDLVGRHLHRNFTQLAARMWNKAPAMMDAMRARGISLPRLGADEMADLVAYLHSIGYFAEPGDPRKGRERVTDKGCLGCHAVSGTAGKTAGDLAWVKGLESPATVISALWNHAFVMGDQTECRKAAWPQFRPEEMADLVSFLQGRGRTP